MQPFRRLGPACISPTAKVTNQCIDLLAVPMTDPLQPGIATKPCIGLGLGDTATACSSQMYTE